MTTESTTAVATTSRKTVKKAAKAEKNGKSTPRSIWTEKRIAIVKAMRKLNATGALSARNSADIAAKAGVEEQDVKHYCYKDEQLCTLGFVKVVKLPETVGISYHLTAKGAKVEMV